MDKKRVFQIPANLFILFRIDKLMNYLNRKKITILAYHGITDSTFSGIQNYDFKHVKLQKFKQQLNYLIKNYNIISLEDFIHVENIPNNLLILTFDDGYKNNFRWLFPILKEKKLPAIIFLTSSIVNTKKINWPDMIEFVIDNAKLDKVEFLSQKFDLANKKNKIETVIRLKRLIQQKGLQERNKIITKLIKKLKVNFTKIPYDYQILNWKEIKEMQVNGMDFGSHTKTHTFLPKLIEEELKKELSDSKKEIEAKLRRRVNAVSYPNGGYNEYLIGVAKEIGYECGLTTEHGLNRIRSNKLKLNRIPVNDSYSINFFIANLYFNFNELNSFFSRFYINLKRLFRK